MSTKWEGHLHWYLEMVGLFGIFRLFKLSLISSSIYTRVYLLCIFCRSCSRLGHAIAKWVVRGFSCSILGNGESCSYLDISYCLIGLIIDRFVWFSNYVFLFGNLSWQSILLNYFMDKGATEFDPWTSTLITMDPTTVLLLLPFLFFFFL